jgi:hypothetical protein
MTCRRVEPIARSSAISRDRWRDDHREGVPDDEGADEQRDAGEHHQHDGEEAEVGLDRVGSLLCDGRARHGLDLGGHGGVQPACQLGVVDAGRRADVDLVEHPRGAEDALRGAGVEVRTGGPAQVVLAAELDGSHHGERLGGTAEQDADPGAEAMACDSAEVTSMATSPGPEGARPARIPTSPRSVTSLGRL